MGRVGGDVSRQGLLVQKTLEQRGVLRGGRAGGGVGRKGGGVVSPQGHGGGCVFCETEGTHTLCASPFPAQKKGKFYLTVILSLNKKFKKKHKLHSSSGFANLLFIRVCNY